MVSTVQRRLQLDPCRVLVNFQCPREHIYQPDDLLWRLWHQQQRLMEFLFSSLMEPFPPLSQLKTCTMPKCSIFCPNLKLKSAPTTKPSLSLSLLGRVLIPQVGVVSFWHRFPSVVDLSPSKWWWTILPAFLVQKSSLGVWVHLRYDAMDM